MHTFICTGIFVLWIGKTSTVGQGLASFVNVVVVCI